MDRKDTNLKVVKDEEPTVEAVVGSDVDINVFFKWDELSQRLASSGQMNPPWFRISGLDDGELLLFTPLGPYADDDHAQEDWDDMRWNNEKAQVASIVGPTKGMIDKLLSAKGAQAEEVSVELIEQCLQALPEGFLLKRPFTVGGKKILDAGERYPAPWKLREMTVDGLQKDELVRAYVLKCLPKKVRDMVHTGALCMAVPETDFMVSNGREKGSPARATMLDHPKAKPAGEDENFGVGSSGDSALT